MPRLKEQQQIIIDHNYIMIASQKSIKLYKRRVQLLSTLTPASSVALAVHALETSPPLPNPAHLSLLDKYSDLLEVPPTDRLARAVASFAAQVFEYAASQVL